MSLRTMSIGITWIPYCELVEINLYTYDYMIRQLPPDQCMLERERRKAIVDAFMSSYC